jgi:hypothetical protein
MTSTYQVRPGDDSAWTGSYTLGEAFITADDLQTERPWTSPQIRSAVTLDRIRWTPEDAQGFREGWLS